MTASRSIRPRLSVVVLSACLLVTWSAAAQDGCLDTETWGDCYLRLSGLDGGPSRAAQKAAADAVAEKIVDAKTTSDDTSDGASSLTNFLPRAAAALGFGELSEEEGSQTLTFSPSSAAQPGTSPDQWKLSLVRRDAEPLAALVQAIPEAIRDARKTTLEDGIDSFDDVELKVEYAFEGEAAGRGFGRSFDGYSAISSAVFDAVAPVTTDDPAQALLAFLQELNAIDPDLRADTRVSTTRSAIEENRVRLVLLKDRFDNETDEARRQALEAKIAALEQEIERLGEIEAAVLQQAARERTGITTFQTALRDANYFRFADLVNNQPQFHFKGHYRLRDDAVGPNEWGLMATYEHGFGNVNGLRRKCSDSPSKKCYEDFFADNAVKSANRLSFSAEWGRVEALRFELPDDDFVFTLDEIRKTIFKAAYGRSLLLDDQGNDVARIDFEGSYEDVSNDPMRQSRGLATLTYTQSLLDNNTLSLSVVWADKPEYRGDVDHEWSARAGLKVKIDKKK